MIKQKDKNSHWVDLNLGLLLLFYLTDQEFITDRRSLLVVRFASCWSQETKQNWHDARLFMAATCFQCTHTYT